VFGNYQERGFSKMENVHDSAMKSLISISIAGILTTIHHVYRLGWGVLPMFLLVIVIPIGLLQLFRRYKYQNNWVLGMYGLFNFLIFLWFGFLDGFLDHVFKLLGLNNITFLAGSEAEIVETVFHLWSVDAGYWFYELTGAFTFIASLFALFFTTKFIMGRLAYDAKQAKRLQQAG
jgi:hypothetical protein